jgi:two-component sensor histidine kinase
VKIPKGKALLPVFEAVSNSLDAIGDRPGGGKVRIEVLRHPSQTDGTPGDVKDVIVEDDGVGFTQETSTRSASCFRTGRAVMGAKGAGGSPI